MGSILVACLSRNTDDPISQPTIPISKIAERADRLYDSDPDSAITLYTVLANRYRPDISRKDKEKIIDSQARKWELCFYRTHNYAESYGALTEALDMMKESGIRNNDIHIMMGNLLYTLGKECNDTSLIRKSFGHFRTAYDDELLDGGLRIDMLAANLILEAQHIDSLATLDRDMKVYAELPGKGSIMRHHNKLLYKAFRLKQEKQYEKALVLMDSIIAMIPDEKLHIRTRIIARLNKAELLRDMGRPDKTIEVLDSALILARGHDVKDAMVEIYSQLGLAWADKGDVHNKALWQNRYYELKDSLVGYNPMNQIGNINTNRELAKVEGQMIQAENKRKMELTGLYFAIFVLVILIIFIIVLTKQIRNLRAANRNLFDKNVEHLEQEKEESARRRSYETRIHTLSTRLDDAMEEIQTLREIPSPSEQRSEQVTEEEKCQPTRCRNIKIDEERKTTVMNSILNTMEETDEWMKPEFTAGRLAELCGCPYALLSQVLNEKEGRNFNTFINNYRIDEACRRIADTEKYGHLTLDAISKSVGFKARSSFVGAFRQKTGMTPSAYQKIARSVDAEKLAETL